MNEIILNSIRELIYNKIQKWPSFELVKFFIQLKNITTIDQLKQIDQNILNETITELKNSHYKLYQQFDELERINLRQLDQFDISNHHEYHLINLFQ